ncbi:putative porin precursor [Prochlorococcus sp. MIT 0703]|nr:putative porin precursor [Prochlorococcus sp. MIT 0703]
MRNQMKLFQQLLVAPAALGLMAPMAANAADLDIKGVSEFGLQRAGHQHLPIPRCLPNRLGLSGS